MSRTAALPRTARLLDAGVMRPATFPSPSQQFRESESESMDLDQLAAHVTARFDRLSFDAHDILASACLDDLELAVLEATQEVMELAGDLPEFAELGLADEGDMILWSVHDLEVKVTFYYRLAGHDIPLHTATIDLREKAWSGEPGSASERAARILAVLREAVASAIDTVHDAAAALYRRENADPESATATAAPADPAAQG